MSSYLNKFVISGLVVIAIIGGILLGKHWPLQFTSASDDAIDPCYGITCLTYHSDLGFSFQYPDHLFVMVDPDEPKRLLIVPKSYKTNAPESLMAIVISVGDNDENMTPMEWLQSPEAGSDPSQKYYQETLDGQDAAQTDGGMWTVVNSPDDTKRLSIASLPSKDGDQLFTEMETVVYSLTFDRSK